jgi:hypothetical protein
VFFFEGRCWRLRKHSRQRNTSDSFFARRTTGSLGGHGKPCPYTSRTPSSVTEFQPAQYSMNALLVSISVLAIVIAIGGFSYVISYLAFIKSSPNMGAFVLALLWLLPALCSLFIPGLPIVVLPLIWLSFLGLMSFNSHVRGTGPKYRFWVFYSVSIPGSLISLGLFSVLASQALLGAYISDRDRALWFVAAAMLSPAVFALLHWLWMKVHTSPTQFRPGS